MADIETELQALRGQILRVKSELEALAEAESVLSEKLRTLGLDESMTTVDLPTVAGLPSRRKKRTHSSAPPPAAGPAWAPAAVGAGLLLGVAIVVLLALNLQASKAAVPPPMTSVLVPVAVPPPVVPPPPPVITSASASPSAEPAVKRHSATSAPGQTREPRDLERPAADRGF